LASTETDRSTVAVASVRGAGRPRAPTLVLYLVGVVEPKMVVDGMVCQARAQGTGDTHRPALTAARGKKASFKKTERVEVTSACPTGA
jgi:hypothetical protein